MKYLTFVLFQAPAHYSFGYGVKDDYSGASFGHKESRDGYKTSGEYFVHLPDGRIQKVSYHADEYGYHPVVSYIGKAHFPKHSKGHGGYHDDHDGYHWAKYFVWSK